MNTPAANVEELLARFVEHHVLTGERLDVSTLCGDRPDLARALQPLIDRYLSLTVSLEPPWDVGVLDAQGPALSEVEGALPQFDGFQTIERLGAGGMGEVFKLRDLKLNRIVAAKIVRARGSARGVGDFLREARAMALFSDPRIVRIFEVRDDEAQPAIVMEYVDGFELGRIGPSLEFPQRARIMAEISEALQHAHSLGVQHRDLKPSNIMLDAALAPKILDFGISGGDPGSGHLVGTPPYVSPEQLDPTRPIDARSDVYSLGVVLYELLCGQIPSRDGTLRLPVEIDPRVPEPLQAIALVAMEADPAKRYSSAAEMAADLRRFLEGRPVLARPSVYASTLTQRTQPHLAHIDEWTRLKLIYPHEADRLRGAYRALEAREDDWIVESRVLSYPQIALYLGAFLLFCGSLFYFAADRWFEAVDGVLRPFAVLGVPFIGLNAAAHLLEKRGHRAVAIAFYLGAVALLPLFLIILFHKTSFLVVSPDTPGQLFDDGSISNRQLQLTTAIACVWCGWLALRTRTIALSAAFTLSALFLTLAIVSDFGLRQWLEDLRWDRLALHVFPLVAAYAGAALASERTSRPWLSRPLYVAAALLFVVLLELLALDGREFGYLGITLSNLQAAPASSPTLLDTLAAMTLNGAIFYLLAVSISSRGSDQMRLAARMLFTIAPFALLQPVGYLVRKHEYSPRFDWLYAACALTIILLSQRRQRRSFYYAGILNLGASLWFIADHREWFKRPAWGIAVVGVGLAVLGAGFLLDRLERNRKPRQPQ